MELAIAKLNSSHNGTSWVPRQPEAVEDDHDGAALSACHGGRAGKLEEQATDDQRCHGLHRKGEVLSDDRAVHLSNAVTSRPLSQKGRQDHAALLTDWSKT